MTDVAKKLPRTEEQQIENAARALLNARATNAQLTPREQAEAAMHATCPYTVDELEDRIRVRRGLPPIHATAPAQAS